MTTHELPPHIVYKYMVDRPKRRGFVSNIEHDLSAFFKPVVNIIEYYCRAVSGATRPPNALLGTRDYRLSVWMSPGWHNRHSCSTASWLAAKFMLLYIAASRSPVQLFAWAAIQCILSGLFAERRIAPERLRILIVVGSMQAVHVNVLVDLQGQRRASVWVAQLVALDNAMQPVTNMQPRTPWSGAVDGQLLEVMLRAHNLDSVCSTCQCMV